MKRIIPFSKYFIPAIVFSLLLCAFAGAGYFFLGFNMGVDFQAGLLQEIQFVPTAFRMTYNGRANASVTTGRNNITIVVSGAGIDELQFDFPYSNYGTLGELVRGISAIEGMNVTSMGPDSVSTSWLVGNAQSDSLLGSTPYTLHYLVPDSRPILIEEVRASLLPLGSVSVQSLGEPYERRFMIRMEDRELESDSSGVLAERRIYNTLENTFGQGNVVVVSSNRVDSRFSKHLTDNAGRLIGITLILILVYASIRFKPQYAIAAVLAIMHDGLIMVGFVVWTQMEFNTITIAAIMTILGYSLNDTIVVFDRMRENRRIYPDETYIVLLDRSVSETLGRTIITTSTTMAAVMSLYIFTTGSMMDFALVLLVGMLSGVYSTIFIASWFVNFWEQRKVKLEKKKMGTEVPRKVAAPKLAKT